MYIVGVSGISGSGKTTFTNILKDSLPDGTVIINQDSYYRGKPEEQDLDEYLKQNFDAPDALDLDLLYHNLLCLIQHNEAVIPFFDMENNFTRHFDHTRIQANGIIILEGIHIFHDPRIRALIDYKIFIDVPSGIALTQRLKRDESERNLPHAYTLNCYVGTVYNMQSRYVKPFLKQANLTLSPYKKDQDENPYLTSDERKCPSTNTPYPYYLINHEVIAQKIMALSSAKENASSLPRGNLFTMSGLFGAGKSTLAKKAYRNKYSERVITYTTREPRRNEENHVDYHFISPDMFFYLSANGFFIITREITGNHYGICRLDLNFKLNRGTVLLIDVLPDVVAELQGNLVEDFPAFRVHSLFIEAPIETCSARMRARGDREESVQSRGFLNAALMEQKSDDFFSIQNINLDEASQALNGYIKENLSQEINAVLIIQETWRRYVRTKALKNINHALDNSRQFFNELSQAYSFLNDQNYVGINQVFEKSPRL